MGLDAEENSVGKGDSRMRLWSGEIERSMYSTKQEVGLVSTISNT
jgi:hypothetical protein